MSLRQDGCRRDDQGRCKDKERQRLDRDIDIGDGNVDGTKQDINNHEVLGTSKGDDGEPPCKHNDGDEVGQHWR